MPTRALLALFASAPLAAAADPIQITTILREGDPIPGLALVTRIDNLAINNARDWIVEADTSFGDTEADSVLWANGATLLTEGQALAAPPGATLDFFDTVILNNLGESAWNFSIDPFPLSEDSGIYFGSDLVIRESDAVGAAGFGPGTEYVGFFECKINDARQVLVMATVDDPAIPSSADRALIVLQLDAGGNLVSETLVVKEGDLLAGQTQAVADFETGPQNFAFNQSGSVMFIADLEGDTATDHAVYVDGTLIAQEGSPESFTGRDWDLLSLAELDLNNNGGWALIGSLAGDTATDGILRTDAQVIAREGFTLPDISPFVIERFGNASDTGPVHIADNGDVLWYGDWSDPDTTRDTGLFRNAELLVQEGVTMIDGLVVDEIVGAQDGFTMSEDGRFILFEATLSDGSDGAFLIAPAGEITPFDGCTPNLASLAHTAGSPDIGASFTVTLDDPQTSTSVGFVFFATKTIVTFPPCGLPLAGAGELLLDVGPPNPVADFVVTAPGGSFDLDVLVPINVQLVGLTFYAQGLFVASLFPPETYRFTNGLEVRFGDG